MTELLFTFLFFARCQMSVTVDIGITSILIRQVLDNLFRHVSSIMISNEFERIGKVNIEQKSIVE